MTTITAWADEVTQVTEALQGGAVRLKGLAERVPHESDPTRALAALWELRTALGVLPLNTEREPAREAARRLREVVAGSAVTAEQALNTLVFGIDNGIARHLDAGGSHAALVRTADFPERLYREQPAMLLGGKEVTLYFTLGEPGQLPAEHKLRNILPADGLIEGRFLMLGRATGNLDTGVNPLPWYSLREAVGLTTKVRTEELRLKREYEEQQAREAEIRRENEPVLGRLQRELREMKAEMAKLKAAQPNSNLLPIKE